MFTYFLTPIPLVFLMPCPLRTLLSQLCAKHSSLHKVDSRTNFQVFMDFMMSMKAAAKPNIFHCKQWQRHKHIVDNYILYVPMQCQGHGAVNIWSVHYKHNTVCVLFHSSSLFTALILRRPLRPHWGTMNSYSPREGKYAVIRLLMDMYSVCLLRVH